MAPYISFHNFIKKYPSIFFNEGSFYAPIGWEQTLDNLCIELVDFNYNNSCNYKIETIKVKFGAPRFYIDSRSLKYCFSLDIHSKLEHSDHSGNEMLRIQSLKKDLLDLIKKHEDKASTVCFYCGKDNATKRKCYEKICDDCYLIKSIIE